MPDGLLDTNLFVHALAQDQHGAECATFLRSLEVGQRQAYLDPLVVHEVTYSLPRVVQGMNRTAVADYLINVVRWPGVVCDRALIEEALVRWRRTHGLGFVDAYLAARAARDGVPIYTKNVRELVAQGATVPDPLPGTTQP
jgi:predicted nucleic acid-binding protein